MAHAEDADGLAVFLVYNFDVLRKLLRRRRRRIFTGFVLQLLSYKTVLAAKRQKWCGTSTNVSRINNASVCALGDTRYSPAETDTGC